MNAADNETIPTQAPDSAHPISLGRRVADICNEIVQRIPTKARLPVLAGVVVLITLAAYTSLSSGSAILNVVCRHNFRSAELSVFIDGKLSYTGQISGTEKNRFGVGILGKQIEGTFSKSLPVSYGEHVVQVHLSSAADGFDQTKRYGINLSRGRDATLLITAQRGSLSLVYQGNPIASSKEDSDYFASMRSMLVTVLGTVVSAGIGFMVQEFLRSRKAA